jgi:hypothetical protein
MCPCMQGGELKCKMCGSTKMGAAHGAIVAAAAQTLGDFTSPPTVPVAMAGSRNGGSKKGDREMAQRKISRGGPGSGLKG